MKSSRLRNHFSILLFVFIFINALSAFAGPGKTTYQAKIVKPDGYPLEVSSVNFKFTILDPAGSCILYAETYSSVNMSGTGGLISFELGSGVKVYPASATTFEQVFSNIAPSLSCDTGGPVSYSPAASDTRKIVMQFHDGFGWQTLPAMSINAVPYAMYANEATKLNGLTSSDFVQVSTVPTCAASEALRYTGAGFTCVAVGNSVTSGTVVTALGYTPADSVSLTTVTSNVSSVSSTVFSVSSTVTSLQNSVAASFAAITSSQWTTSGTNIFYNTGNIGIGTTTPVTKLDVSGGVRIGAESTTCAPALAGTLRYNASNVEYCNGTSWQAFGVSGSGITNFNGSTSGTQSFATGTGGTAPNINTLNGVHTLNIPLANTGSVTAGLISNIDYTTFTNKITSSAASIAQVLGYVPADNSVSGTYAQKANNLSDLTNVATARANLGLGTFATASSIDLGSASATGTLAIARLPNFAGDATITAASNTIILSNSGVTAGTYTKVTVDSKGRVTSSSALASSDVTAALGYTPANSATTISSQWNTSGTTINYINGSVGIGTTTPNAQLNVKGAGTTAATSSLNITDSASSSKLFVRDDGNVGIGTTTPEAKLDVRGVVRSQTGNSTNPGFSFEGTTTTGISTAPTFLDRVYIIANGNLSSTFGPGELIVGSDYGTIGKPMIKGAGTTATSPAYGFYAEGLGFYRAAAEELAFSTNSIERIRISSAGAVGIGLSTPTAKLHLAAGNSSNASLKLTSGTLLTSPQSGTIEYDGFNFYLTDSTNTRRAIAANANLGTYDNVSNINSSSNITLTPTGSVVVSSTTASTNPSTGALVVKGGLGVVGDIYTSGTIVTSSNIQGVSVTATSGMISPYIAGGVASGGSLTLDSTTHSSKGNILLASNGGNVGVGTTAPAVKLDTRIATTHSVSGSVAGSYPIANFINNGSDTGERGIQFGAPTGNILSPVYLKVTGTSSRFSILNQFNTENFTVLDSGNVGVGTTTPDHKMRVIGKIKVGTETDNVSANLQSDVNDILELVSPNTASAPAMSFHHRGLHTVQLSGFGSSVTNQGLRIKSGPGEQPAQLHVEGKVGVGTTNPQSLLQLGQSAMTGTPPSTVEARRLSIATNTHTGATFDFFTRDTPANANLDIRYAGASSTILTLTHAGNVGIGASSPANTLDVLGTGLTVTRNQTFGTLATFNKSYTATNNEDPYLQFRHQTSDGGAYGRYGYIQSGQSHNGLSLQGENGAGSPSYILLNKFGGNVGIGISSPTSLMEIYSNSGYMKLTGASVKKRIIMGNQDSGGVNNPAIIESANGFLAFGGGNSWSTDDGGTMDYTMMLADNGNVGIGTTTPSSRFEVALGGSGGNGMTLSQPAVGAAPFFTWKTGDASNNLFSARYIGGASGYFEMGTGDNLSWSPKMSITASGSVGIGTTAPTTGYKLDVLGDIYVGAGGSAQTIRFRTANTDGGFIRFNSTADSAGNSSLELGTTDNNDEPIIFTQSGSERMRIHTNGGVGIGTTAPGYTLHVVGTAGLSTGTAWTNASDMRLKDIQGDYEYGLNEVLKLHTVRYNYKKDNALGLPSDFSKTGFIAQEVQKVIPDAVNVRKDGYLELNVDPIHWAVVNAVQDLYKLVVEIKNEILGEVRGLASIVESKADKAEIEVLKQKAAKLEVKAAEVDVLKAENVALKSYLCSKDPAASICK